MQVTVTNDSACRKTVRIEISADQVQETIARVLKEYRKKASVPGFRPGKAPDDILMKRFKNDILQSAQDRLRSDAYQTSVKQENLQVVKLVDASDEPLRQNEAYTFTYQADVEPEFELPEYKGIPVESRQPVITEEAVDEGIKNYCRQFERHDITTRPIREHDVARISFTGTMDGRPLSEVLKPEEQSIASNDGLYVSCDEHEMLPGLGVGLIGLSSGDEKDVLVDFPSSFPNAAVAGKEAVFHVKVLETRERVTPEVNDELLAKANVKTVEELRSAVRTALERHAAEQDMAARTAQIERYLLDRASFDISESELESATSSEVYRIVNRNIMEGVDKDVIAEHKDHIYEAAANSGRDQIKLGYMLDRIAARENITVAQQEINLEIARQAMAHQEPVDRFKKNLAEKGHLDTIETYIRRSKTFNLLVKEAKVTEAPAPVA